MPIPELLVSVRNLSEARAAIDGGCDRLDVKEPSRGPLGMADAGVISQVAGYSSIQATGGRTLPCSIALGEIEDRRTDEEALVLPAGVSDAKLGPANLDTPARWIQGWRSVTNGRRSSSAPPVRWVAVAYADWSEARSVPPAELLAQAIEVGSDAFLIDTCRKDGSHLLDWLSADELDRLADEARRRGLTFALAGSLRLEHFPALVPIRPDVIAVRGAACEGGKRAAAVSSACVRRLKTAIWELF